MASWLHGALISVSSGLVYDLSQGLCVVVLGSTLQPQCLFPLRCMNLYWLIQGFQYAPTADEKHQLLHSEKSATFSPKFK